MPPKQRITREMILECAFVMFLSEGMETVNARSVAKALGCSTQPIFSYFTGMQDLKSALDAKAQEMYVCAVTSLPKSENWLVDMLTEHVRFACEHVHVYNHLFLSVRANPARLSTYNDLFGALAQQVQEKEGVSSEIANRIVDEVGIYANGLINRLQIRGYESTDVHHRINTAYDVVLAHLK